MKKSILTMFLIVLISPLGSAMAGDGFRIALCSGGAGDAVFRWTENFAPTVITPATCSAHFVGCKNTAKESTKCSVGVVDNVLRQLKEECAYQTDRSACEASFVAFANHKKDYFQYDRDHAEDYCADQYSLCLSSSD